MQACSSNRLKIEVPEFIRIANGLMERLVRFSVEVSGTDDRFSARKSESHSDFVPLSLFIKIINDPLQLKGGRAMELELGS